MIFKKKSKIYKQKKMNEKSIKILFSKNVKKTNILLKYIKKKYI